MEPGEVHHNLSMHGSGDFRVVIIPPKVLREYSLESGGPEKPHFRLIQTSNAGFYQAFVRLHRSLENPATALERQAYFAECARLILERCIESGLPFEGERHERKGVIRARDFIQDHFSQNLSLNQLAQVSGMSRYHFLRAFRGETGLPPHAFQIQLRIGRARQMLKRKTPIVEVAQEVGFFDQSHFTKHFKRALGVTPARYLYG